MSGKDPSVMRIHELKEAIEARGLTSKTLGFVEKHEFVTLLTQEFDQPIINKSTSPSIGGNHSSAEAKLPTKYEATQAKVVLGLDQFFHGITRNVGLFDEIKESQSPTSPEDEDDIHTFMETARQKIFTDLWKEEKSKKIIDRETEQSFNEDEYEAKLLYLCKRYNERGRLEELLHGPLASADLTAIKNDLGRNGLLIAAHFDNDAVIDALLKHNMDVDSTDKSDYTALIIASQEGSYNASRVLVKHGCNIGYKTKGEGGWGYTALTVACARGHMNIVKLLVEHGADVNIQETNGFTPVIEACRFGHIEITLYLMKHGADIFKRDYLGRSIEQLYGNGVYPPPNVSSEVRCSHLKLVKEALQYTPDRNWERRKHFIQMLVENGYLASDASPSPSTLSPHGTKEYDYILESTELTRLIVSYI